jgi:hypothetical protein
MMSHIRSTVTHIQSVRCAATGEQSRAELADTGGRVGPGPYMSMMNLLEPQYSALSACASSQIVRGAET